MVCNFCFIQKGDFRRTLIHRLFWFGARIAPKRSSQTQNRFLRVFNIKYMSTRELCIAFSAIRFVISSRSDQNQWRTCGFIYLLIIIFFLNYFPGPILAWLSSMTDSSEDGKRRRVKMSLFKATGWKDFYVMDGELSIFLLNSMNWVILSNHV